MISFNIWMNKFIFDFTIIVSYNFNKLEVLMGKVLIYGWGSSLHLGIPEVNEGLVNLFKKMKVDYVIHEDEATCAEGLSGLGYNDELIQIAPKIKEKIEKAVEKHGISVIVTPFAASYYGWNYTLKKEGFELPVPMVHISQYLYDNLPKLHFKEYKKRVLIHDGCRLGRYAGVVKEPREVLKAIPSLELLEIHHPELEVGARNLKPWDMSPCPGGWLEITMQPLMKHVAKNVIDRYVMPEEPDIVTSTCANGYHAFKAGKEYGGHNIEVKFFSNIVEEALLEE